MREADGVISRTVCAVGSLRNPVGPLPSSIYWRRRAVLLSVVLLLALLATWIVTTGGSGGGNGSDQSNGKNPAPSITPGPSSSGPAISQHPGGRDESGDSDGSSGSGSGDGGSGDSGGSGGSAGSGGAVGAGGGSVGTGTVGSGGGTVEDGGPADTVPAGSSLPDCTAGDVRLTVRSEHNSYAPGEKPSFKLTAENTSGKDCKVDLGPKATEVTITHANADDPYWSSADCATASDSLLFRVPAKDSVTRTVEWDRKPSDADKCRTKPSGSAGAGTYLVEAKAPKLTKAQTSFVLKKD